MANSEGQAVINWSDLHNLNVVEPVEGKILGKVEDFFFKEGTNAVYALCVRTRLHGDLSLPVTGIKSVGKDHVNVVNEQMLAKALPPLGRGQQLLARKVMSSAGQELGTVKEVMLNVEPVQAMRVAGFEVTHGSSSDRFGAVGVAHYDDENNALVVYDHLAKKLR